MEKTLLQIAQRYKNKDLIMNILRDAEAVSNWKKCLKICDILDCKLSTAIEIFVKHKRK